MTKKLFAFWRYDTFPFYLGGEMIDMNDKGQVYIPKYQAWFTPVLILPYEEGVKRNIEIDKICKQHNKDIKEIMEKNTDAVEKIMKLSHKNRKLEE